MENNVNVVQNVEPAAEPAKKNVYTVVHGIFALLALVLGALYYNWVLCGNAPFENGGRGEVGVFAFAIAFAVYVAAFVFARKKKTGFETWFFMAAFLAVAVRFLLHEDDGVVMVAAFLVIHALALLLVASMRESVAESIVPRGLKACFAAPFMSFHTLPVAVVKGFFKRDKTNKNTEKSIENVVYVVAGLCVAMPVVAVVLVLLASDSFFGGFLGDVAEFISEINFWDYVNPLTILVALFLFGALYSGDKEKIKRNPLSVSLLPSALINTVIITLLAVYGIFIIAQIDGYAAMIMGKIPEGVTYAEFAKSGFFSLCAVACINGAVIYISNVFAEEKANKVTTFSVILTAVTLVLLGTAAVKMGMYISAYGFTEKRLFTIWFMLLLAALFVMTLIKLKKPAFKLSKYSVYTSGVMIVILCDVNYVWLSDKINLALGFVK